MGRYYTGDIEGKFWFGVQSSDDANFFGGESYIPQYLNFNFNDFDMPNIDKGIKKCRQHLSGYKRKLDKFFKEHNGYNDEMIINEGICKTTDEVKEVLEWYARLSLGLQIRECVKKTGHCSFEAEY